MIKTMNNNIKERPILFSADMVRALIQDYHNPGQYKNQTRRTRGLERFNTLPEFLTERGWEIYDFVEEEPGLWLAISNDESGEFPDIFNPWIKCPYGKVGDRLWVRESNLPMPYPEGWISKIAHKLSIPSIHMPRWASRILLEITEVKIERLKEITWKDAQLEGIECVWHDDYTSDCLWKDYTGKSTGLIYARESFFSLWKKIKGTDSINLNQWVWVIKFKVLTINGVCDE